MKFCVINCENSTKWSPISFPDMFRAGFERDGDTWEFCNVASGDSLPDDLLQYQGVVITGSRFNCRDRSTLPWFEDVCKFILDAATLGSPKIYGGCFGCQIIGFALGGEVDYNPNKRFVLKAENIKWAACQCGCCGDDSTCQCELPANISKCIIEKLKSSNGLRLIESHGDCVCKLPDNALLVASSSTCKSEMFLAGAKHNIWTCQSHPEFDLQYAIKERIWVSVVELNKRLSEEEAETAQKSFEEYNDQDAKLVIEAISDFLHQP